MSEPQLGPDGVLGFVLVRTYHHVARRFHESLAPLGLTPMQFGVLVAISRDPDVSQAQIARQVLVTPQSFGEMLPGLEDRGLIRRADPLSRGRPARVALTDEGAALLGVAAPIVAALNEPAALGLTQVEHQRLDALLKKVLAQLGGS